MIEKYGYQKTKDQIEQRSKFYIKNLIEGKKINEKAFALCSL